MTFFYFGKSVMCCMSNFLLNLLEIKSLVQKTEAHLLPPWYQLLIDRLQNEP